KGRALATQRRMVTRSWAQRRALEQGRDHDPRPSVRERGAARLKSAAGASADRVARPGLWKAREPATVAGWLAPSRADGLAGLTSPRPGGDRRSRLRPGGTDRPLAGSGGAVAPAAGGARAAGAGAGRDAPPQPLELAPRPRLGGRPRGVQSSRRRG